MFDMRRRVRLVLELVLAWLAIASTVPTALGAATVVDDSAGVLGRTEAPVTATFALSSSQRRAAQEGRLGVATPSKTGGIIPVQWDLTPAEARGTWLMPSLAPGRLEFRPRSSRSGFVPLMRAAKEARSGQVDLWDEDHRVLRYNYVTVEPGDLLEKVSAGNRIYARARSDYIHPLFGPSGEELTRDWAVDHPHHRGIYWAWPEVSYGSEQGDLHALQRVFARPTGQVRLESGPVFAQVTAENQWLWEDREPIVRETAVIRAYRATGLGRIVDLTFQFVALKDGVTLARRGMDKYGGLNLRMATPGSQRIVPFLDEPGTAPRRAWSDLSGRFSGAAANAGLMVIQHQSNPDYPGDWVQYPDLAWCQPTFPRAGTRFPLVQNQPLVLRYRLCVHPGDAPANDVAARLCDAFNREEGGKRVVR